MIKKILKSFLLFSLMTLALPVGATVTTFYPSAGDTSPIDGSYDNDTTTWDLAHDNGTADYVENGSNAQIRAGAEKISGVRWIVTRMRTDFDTSIIGAGSTITAAEWGGKTASDFAFVVSDTMNVVSHTIADLDTINTTDMAFANWGTTSYGSILNTTIVDETYMPITLSDFSGISKTGLTKFGIRFGNDIADTDPGGGRSYWGIHSADTTGTSEDPYLTVTYSTAAGAPEPVHRTINNGRVILNNGRMIIK